jgi:tetratricopeptide (TPR) repeat protein
LKEPGTVAGIWHQTGMVYERLREPEAAENAYRESLAMKRKLLGDSHPLIADGMSNLGFVLYRKGDRQGGIELLRDALKMRRQELGAEHPDVAGGAGDLAYLLIESGEYQEAGPLVDESLVIGRKLFGNEDPRVGGTLVMKASLLAATGHYLESQQAVAEAKRIFAGSLPEDHWLVAWAKSVEGAALTGLREYQAAEPLLLQSVDGLKDSPLPGLPASGRIRLAELYTAWGKPEQALKFRSK